MTFSMPRSRIVREGQIIQQKTVVRVTYLGSASRAVCYGVARLAAARQADGRQLSPTLVTDRAAVDARGAEAGDFLCHIVAHKVDLMLAVGFRGMDRELGRRCCEDQPAAAGVSER